MDASQDRLPRLPPREADSHKGTYGRVLIVGGSRGMSGAVALAGMAALRGGAGLVRLAVPDATLDGVAAHEPSYMTAPLPNDDQGRISASALEPLLELAATADALAVGPGLGRSPELTELVAALYAHVACPMVLDADALNALASLSTWPDPVAGPRVLTPHPGEFSRLVGARLPAERAAARAVELAAKRRLIVLLKGHRSLVTDGRRQARNATGNPGLATGGTGDVLTGLLAALLAQRLEPFDAARLAAHLHGLAGDLAAARFGQVSLIARDVVEYLPAAFQQLDA